MTDYADVLTLERYDNEALEWKDVKKWTDRTSFDADTLQFTLAPDLFDRPTNRFRMRTRTIFGKEVVSDAVDVDGIAMPEGISPVLSPVDDANAPAYTLDGRKVNPSSAKGIIIRNGRKLLK